MIPQNSQGFLQQDDESSGFPEDFPPAGFSPTLSHLPGIEIYIPTELVEKRPEVVDFKCPKCGATIAFSVEENRLVCEYCGYAEALKEQRLGSTAEGFEFKVETLERSEKGWGDERKELACQRCGGVVSAPPDVLTYTCPFCGSNKVLFREPMEDVLRPRYLIPFRLTPQDSRDTVRRWLGSSWMSPSELRKAAEPDKFHPLYIPYWTFSAVSNATWKAEVGYEKVEHYRQNGEETEYRKIVWRNEAGKVQKLFSDLLVPGTTHLNLATLGKIDTFDIGDLILYEPKHLAGMQAQAYDLPLNEAWEVGRQVLRERTRRACLDKVSSTQIRAFSMSLDFSDEQWRYILVPIYTSVYRYLDKPYQILVNGQTGRVAGPRPVDWEKVWLVIAGLFSPGLVFTLVGWLFSADRAGEMTAATGVFLLVVALVITFFLIRTGLEMEHV